MLLPGRPVQSNTRMHIHIEVCQFMSMWCGVVCVRVRVRVCVGMHSHFYQLRTHVYNCLHL